MACCLEQEEAGFDFIPKPSPLLQEPWSAISQLGGRDILLCLYYFLLSHWQSKAHRDDFLVKEGVPWRWLCHYGDLFICHLLLM